MPIIYSIQHTDINKPGFIINPSQINGLGGPKSNSSLILHGATRLRYGEAINENFLHLLENFASPARITPLVQPIQTGNNSGSVGSHFITILEDKSDIFINGFEFNITNSAGAINNGTYTTVSSSYHQPSNLTTIVLVEQLVNDVLPIGDIGDVSYSVIEPEPTMVRPPYNEGQLWFNNSSGILYIYRDVTGSGHFQWDIASKSVISSTPPAVPIDGDLWYDPVEEQLKIYANGTFDSVADRYVLKSGDEITPDIASSGIGTTSGVLRFNNPSVTDVLFLNEGHGDSTIAPDIRSINQLLITANEDVIINYDDNNNSTGELIIAKGGTNSLTSTDILKIANSGVIHSEIPSYETLIVNDNDIPNKKYVDDEIVTQIDAADHIVNNSSDDYTISSNINNANHLSASLKLRELNEAGAQTGIINEAPRLGFVWNGRNSSQLAIETNGAMSCYDESGVLFEDFKAKNLYENNIQLANKYLGLSDQATDSALLNGKFNNQISTPTTIVERDSSGDISARLFRSEYDVTSPTINYIMTQIDTVSNNYIRPSTPAQVRDALNISSLPVGSVVAYGSSTIPTDLLKCNGAAISRTTYANLFAAIGITHGAGDGSTTFNLPDLRGEFIRGFDDGRGIDSGRVFGSFQNDEFESHSHTYHSGFATGSHSVGDVDGNSASFTHSTNSTGGTETRPRNIALTYCIKY